MSKNHPTSSFSVTQSRSKPLSILYQKEKDYGRVAKSGSVNLGLPKYIKKDVVVIYAFNN